MCADLKPCPSCGRKHKRIFPVVHVENSSIALRCLACGFEGEAVVIDTAKPASVGVLINPRLTWDAMPRPVLGGVSAHV